MKYLLCLLFASCVTAGDLQRITDQVVLFEETLYDDSATVADVQDGLTALREGVAEVVEDVREREDNALSSMSGELGVAGILTAFGLNYMRDRRRRMLGEPTKVGPPGA